MPVNLCAECYLSGYCRRLTSRAVTPEDTTPAFIADVRSFMRNLAISRDRWVPFLDRAYCDYPGRIVDAGGEEVMLDTGVLDASGIRYWFRDLCRPMPQRVRPHLRRQAKARFLVMASILRAIYPVEASLWGVVIANDNDGGKTLHPVRIDGCPYQHFRIG